MRKNVPNMAKNVSAIPADATLKRRSRNSFRSSIGYLVRASRTAKAASATPARVKIRRVSPDSHPLWGPSMIP